MYSLLLIYAVSSVRRSHICGKSFWIRNLSFPIE
jgi:hypothetical protein